MKRAPRTPTDKEKLLTQAADISDAEARFLVSSYYASQEMRKRLDLQLRHAVGEGAADAVPIPTLLTYTADRFGDVEGDVAKALAAYGNRSRVGLWCRSHVGVGPVITAGCLAYLDITKAPTAGHFWAFAGQDPTRKWGKGEKRPYCAAMKQIVYHLGECIKRTSNNERSFYGKIYRERKELLVKRNEEGYNAERAKTFITKSAEVKKTLASGKLPAGNLDRQACNYVAKMFLSHLHAVMYWDHHGTLPPKPFVIEHGGHVHFIRPPNLEEHFADMSVAYDAAERAVAA